MTAAVLQSSECNEAGDLDWVQRALIDGYQRGFPLTEHPYATIAEALGVSESAVLEALADLRECGVLGRIGAVVRPHRAGWSTLAALEVPEARLEEVAALVSAYPEVNHNYEREHELNLWFVVAAAERGRVEAVLDDIELRSGLEVLELPLEEAFCLDLGFAIRWARS
jgi:DNA-binding Lrp family transcriptional regulator